jgi:hypothetical protein
VEHEQKCQQQGREQCAQPPFRFFVGVAPFDDIGDDFAGRVLFGLIRSAS